MDDIKTRTAPGQHSLSSQHGPRECCLIEIHGPHPGRKHELNLDGNTTIGRTEETAVTIPWDSVSRQHAIIRSTISGFWIEDTSSKNGTSLNDQQLLPFKAERLTSGCYLKIGGAILKFLAGENLEALEVLYHAENERIKWTDGVTSSYNRAYFLNFLDREFKRTQQSKQPLSLAVIGIDHLRSIKDLYGILVEDDVLRELAALMREKWTVHKPERESHCFARYNGDEFAIIAPGLAVEDVRSRLELIRASVARHVFRFDGQEMKLTVSIGAAGLTPAIAGKMEFLRVADACLYRARKSGGNQLVLDVDASSASNPKNPSSLDAGTAILRRAPSGVILAKWIAAQESPGALLALEIDGEKDIKATLGTQEFRKWSLELEDIAKNLAISSQEILGIWKDRVLVSLKSEGSESRAQQLSKEIQSAWAQMSIPSQAKGRLSRSLRSVLLTPAAVKENRERILDLLEVKLLEEAMRTGVKEALAELPFPLAATRELVDTQQTSLLRLYSIRKAVDIASRFLVSIGMGLLHTYGSDLTCAEGTMVLARNSGASDATVWLRIATQLAQLLPSGLTNPAAEALYGLIPQRTEGPSLVERMLSTLKEIQQIQHQVTAPDEFYSAQALESERVLDDLLDALSPLKSTRLVSRAEIKSFNSPRGIRYKIANHQGGREYFAISEEDLEIQLKQYWCYLLAPASIPLCLEPIVAALPCKQCGRTEVFMAGQITVGENDISMKGVITTHNALLSRRE